MYLKNRIENFRPTIMTNKDENVDRYAVRGKQIERGVIGRLLKDSMKK